MLRITVHEKLGAITFQLEGELRGPWVQELKTCWRTTQKAQDKPTFCIDLTGVTFIDTEGKACLTTLHRQGAEFVAADCLTKAIVEEITDK